MNNEEDRKRTHKRNTYKGVIGSSSLPKKVTTDYRKRNTYKGVIGSSSLPKKVTTDYRKRNTYRGVIGSSNTYKIPDVEVNNLNKLISIFNLLSEIFQTINIEIRTFPTIDELYRWVYYSFPNLENSNDIDFKNTVVDILIREAIIYGQNLGLLWNTKDFFATNYNQLLDKLCELKNWFDVCQFYKIITFKLYEKIYELYPLLYETCSRRFKLEFGEQLSGIFKELEIENEDFKSTKNNLFKDDFNDLSEPRGVTDKNLEVEKEDKKTYSSFPLNVPNFKEKTINEIRRLVPLLEAADNQKEFILKKAEDILDQHILRAESGEITIRKDTRPSTNAAAIIYAVLRSNKYMPRISGMELAKMIDVSSSVVTRQYKRWYKDLVTELPKTINPYRYHSSMKTKWGWLNWNKTGVPRTYEEAVKNTADYLLNNVMTDKFKAFFNLKEGEAPHLRWLESYNNGEHKLFIEAARSRMKYSHIVKAAGLTIVDEYKDWSDFIWSKTGVPRTYEEAVKNAADYLLNNVMTDKFNKKHGIEVGYAPPSSLINKKFPRFFGAIYRNKISILDLREAAGLKRPQVYPDEYWRETPIIGNLQIVKHFPKLLSHLKFVRKNITFPDHIVDNYKKYPRISDFGKTIGALKNIRPKKIKFDFIKDLIDSGRIKKTVRFFL